MRRLALLALMLTAACHDTAPSGQVLARVDGRDITDTELAAEARAAPASRAELLDRLVDRALLASAAHRRKADLQPVYLADVRRARDMLAVEALRRQVASQIPAPGDAAVRAYATAHPWAFANRALVTLAAPGGAASSYDTAALDAGVAAAIGAGAVGATVVVGGRPYQVIARKPLPVAPADAWAQARAAIVAEQADGRMRALLQNEKAGATIRYQTGFGPAREP